MIDGVLMLGFGGPTPGCCGRRAECPKTPGCEAPCFVAGILGDNPARARRVHEVVAHYRQLGGFSPYNELTYTQARALEAELARRGRAIPVACGFRHWNPWPIDALRELRDKGCRELALIVLAPHQSSVSWDWYIKVAGEAVDALGNEDPQAPVPRIAHVAPPFFDSPGFIAALADRLREATAGWSAERVAKAALVFTAHAIPTPVERTAPYRQQFATTARLAAEAFGHPEHRLAFQSAPSESAIPWSGPDILAVVDEVAASGATDIILCPAGFLVDHTEVLYDLDIEAKQRAEAKGMAYTRAVGVHDHTALVRTFAERAAS